MCTVSFLRLTSGYSLMMNRDESPLRPQSDELREAPLPAIPGQPARALYPIDPTSQGTWIGVNDLGIAFALMNQYPVGTKLHSAPQSRGRLIPEALLARSAGGGLERVAAMDLLGTPPFQLVGFEDGHAPLAILWNGAHLERRLYPDGALQLSVSSVNANEVQPAREAQFDLMLQAHEGRSEAELLAAQESYHLSQEPQAGPTAVWMTRSDAQTVSMTHLLVLPRQTVLRQLSRAAREMQAPPQMAVLLRV